MTQAHHLTRVRQQELAQEMQRRAWNAQARPGSSAPRGRLLRVLRLQRP